MTRLPPLRVSRSLSIRFDRDADRGWEHADKPQRPGILSREGACITAKHALPRVGHEKYVARLTFQVQLRASHTKASAASIP